MLCILRNPRGVSEGEQQEACWRAANLLEGYIQEQALKRVKQHKKN